MANGLYPILTFTPAPAVSKPDFVLTGEVRLFPIRRAEKTPGEAESPDGAEFTPRWWPAPDFDAE